MARKVYIARHGERLDFVDRIWHETAANPYDPPLTANGKQQATELGLKLASLNISSVYSSPFTRCVNTASNAAAQISPGLKVQIEPGACEWLNGEWYADTEDGPGWRNVAELREEFGNVEVDYEPVYCKDYNKKGYPESMGELMERCKRTVLQILMNEGMGDGNVLLIGHGSSVKGFMGALVDCVSENISCKFKFMDIIYLNVF